MADIGSKLLAVESYRKRTISVMNEASNEAALLGQKLILESSDVIIRFYV